METQFQPYYGQEADQFVFYKLPKLLFTDAQYKHLSSDSKILYGFMIDRMELSIRNGWQDKNGETYIYFTQAEAADLLNIRGKDKIVSVYRELETAGLMRRKRQGLGKPDKIYIGRLIPIPASSVQKSEKRTSGSAKNGVQEIRKTEFHLIETDISDTEISQSIHQRTAAAPPAAARKPETADVMNMVRSMESWREAISLQLEADRLKTENPELAETITRTVELIAEVCASSRPTVRIGKQTSSRAAVRERLEMLTSDDLLRVLNDMPPTSQTSNPRAYILTSLYNAPTTPTKTGTDKPERIQISDDERFREYAEELHAEELRSPVQ